MKKNYFFLSSLFFFLLSYNSIAQCLPTSSSTYSQNDFGNNEWIAHTYDYSSSTNDYNSSTFDTISNYQGYYIDAGYGTSGISFDSSDSFNTSSNPSTALTYQGCPMSGNDTYNVVYKRKGFPVATDYQISIEGASGENGNDDAAKLYIDGTLVWSNTGCCSVSANVWSGSLDGDSEIIFIWSERAGQSYGRMLFENIPAGPTTPPEDTSFGNFEWKVGVYDGANFDTYYGSYNHKGVSFNTEDLWADSDNPTDASGPTSLTDGYVGTTGISDDRHSYVYRREGFDCGYYNLDILRHDDAIEVIVDGVTVYQKTTWDNRVATLDVWDGYLDANSQIEIRMRETQGGDSILTIDLTATYGQANDPNEYIWIGGADTDPTNAANWCDAVPPNDGTASISVSGDADFFPVYSSSAEVDNFIIESGAQITFNSGFDLDVNGDFDNHGTILITDGELQFTGTTAQTLTGEGFDVDYLEVNNPAGVTL
ncbi:hypothetical protein SAMN04488096_1031, partial [Mesonia phycicola]